MATAPGNVNSGGGKNLMTWVPVCIVGQLLYWQLIKTGYKNILYVFSDHLFIYPSMYLLLIYSSSVHFVFVWPALNSTGSRTESNLTWISLVLIHCHFMSFIFPYNYNVITVLPFSHFIFYSTCLSINLLAGTEPRENLRRYTTPHSFHSQKTCNPLTSTRYFVCYSLLAGINSKVFECNMCVTNTSSSLARPLQ